MKFTAGEPHSSTALLGASILTTKVLAQNPNQSIPHSDLVRPPLRKTRSLTRLKRAAPSVGRRCRPEEALLKWKVEEGEERDHGAAEDEDYPVAEEEKQSNSKVAGNRGRKQRNNVSSVSARKLAFGLWKLQSPETSGGGGGLGERMRRNGLVFQRDAAHVSVSFAPPHTKKVYGPEPLHSGSRVSGVKNRFSPLRKPEPSFQFPNTAMEGATKWDPVCFDRLPQQIYGHMKRLNLQVSDVSMVSALETELEQARARIQELETEQWSSKKKLEHFLKKVSEERAAWRSREHEKIRALIDDVKTDLSRERKYRHRLEILNSKLVNELADAKVSAKRLMQDYEKERKNRVLIEQVCDELAKEIGDDKAEIEAMKRESMNVREEVDDERKMLQMAEVWREERVQMKLVDAKLAVEEKYSQMNMLVADLESFLRSRGAISEIRQAEPLVQAAASIDIQEVKEFSYEPSNQDDIFDVLEEVNSGGPNERDIEQCAAFSPANLSSKMHMVTPEANLTTSKDYKHRHSDLYVIRNEEIEEEDDDDESEWETVSHLEDQGSSFSPDRSILSVKKCDRYSNVSESGTEWEDNIPKETPMAEISELCHISVRQSKKVSGIARLWKSGSNEENCKINSVDGMNGRFINGRKSSAGVVSPDPCSGKDGEGAVSPSDMVHQWSSPEPGNPHITMKGCIEWPRGVQKHILKSNLLEARMPSQKVQLRNVLKQKKI